MCLRDRFANAEFQDLHVLVGIVHHTRVSCPCQPRWDRRRQITAEQLRRERVKRGRGYAHLQIQTACPDEESHALETKGKTFLQRRINEVNDLLLFCIERINLIEFRVTNIETRNSLNRRRSFFDLHA